MSKFTEMMKNRRSIYALGENLPISKEEVTALVKEVVREVQQLLTLKHNVLCSYSAMLTKIMGND